MLNLVGVLSTEQLLKREDTVMFTKEGTRVSSLNTGVSCVFINKTVGRRKMFITRANAAS